MQIGNIEIGPGATVRAAFPLSALRARGVSFDSFDAQRLRLLEFSIKGLPINTGPNGVSLDYFTTPDGIAFGRTLDVPEGATVEVAIRNDGLYSRTVGVVVLLADRKAA